MSVLEICILKVCPFITERLLMGRKESNQTSKQKYVQYTSNLYEVCTESSNLYTFLCNVIHPLSTNTRHFRHVFVYTAN